MLGNALVIIGVTPAQADTGGPDLCGYEWTDSNEPPPQVNFTWLDIVDNGTKVAQWNVSDDDGFAGPFPLGFAFTHYDVIYTEAFIETNGYVAFGEGSGWIPSEAIPSREPPNNFAAAYGTDLNPSTADGSAGVYYVALSDPDRFVVEYYQIPHYPDYDPVTFEIILYETGEIWFHYLEVTSEVYVIGLEDAAGSTGIAHDTNVTDGLAVRFAPPTTAPAPVAVDMSPCNHGVLTIPGATEDVPLTVTNAGTAGNDTFDLTVEAPAGWSATLYEEDGTTLLNDTNGDSVPDTGELAPSEAKEILLRVEIPTGGLGESVLDVTATSSADETVSDVGRGSFRVVPAIFAPPHADFGNDTDGDGRFDFLMVDVDISVGLDWSLYVFAYFHDESYSIILDDYEFGYFSAGTTTLRFAYDGMRINASDQDGPYYVDLAIVDPSTGMVIQRDVHTTVAYSYFEFETPAAAYRPPHTDFGLDSDGDGKYDYLVLDASVSVNVGRSYYLSVDLCGWINGSGFCLWNSTSTYLDPGNWSVRFLFDGGRINASDIDGPYLAQMHLLDGSTWQVLDREDHSTDAYSHLDFETPQAMFAPPHADSVQDLDEDGLYDFLNVDAMIAVDVNGTYVLQASLRDANYSLSLFSSNTTYLEAGLQSLRVSFDGSALNTSGADGPYVVEMYLYEYGTGIYLDSDTHTTAAYNGEDFNGPRAPASFRPPHEDLGVDTDGDGLYNYLIVRASVAVRESGYYMVYGNLHAGNFSLSIGTSNSTYLDPGILFVGLPFDGRAISASDIDGPYTAELSLYRYEPYYGWVFLENGTYTTAQYGSENFDGPPARFVRPHGESGMDSDADGRYNVLVVDANLTTEYSSRFYVGASLYNENGTNASRSLYMGASTFVDLTPGNHSIQLQFDGVMINASGADGPYWVALWLYDAYSWQFMDNDTFRTRAYSHTDFEELPTILSPQTGTVPTIDGTIGTQEWSDAIVVDLSAIEGNMIPGYLYVKDDNQFLYVAYDATGDTTRDINDYASIAFDTENDRNVTNGREDIFFQTASAGTNQGHYVWQDGYGWVVHDAPYDPNLPDHRGLASTVGFATSPVSGVPHRIFEFAIPLALLGVQPGDVIGFQGGSPISAGLFDSYSYRYSYWPWPYGVWLDLYGDLVLSRDSTAPTISITSPAFDSLFSGDDVDVEWVAGDVGLGIDRFELTVDGGALTVLSAGDVRYKLADLPDGVHVVAITAIDRAGNSETATISITIDTTAPSLAIDTPTDGDVLGSNDIVVEWTAADATSGIDHFEVSLDSGASVRAGPGVGSYTLANLAEGSHRVTVTSYDRAGHSQIAAISFTVDTIAPAFALQAPTDGAILPSPEIAVSWIALDLGSGLDRIEVRMDGSAGVVLPGTAGAYTFTGVADGTHVIGVAAIDLAGNRREISLSVTVDATAPSLAITTPTPGAHLVTGNVAVAWTAADTTTGLRQYELRLDGGAPISVSLEVTSYVFASLRDGTHTVTLTATDRVGNFATASVTFTVDTALLSPSGPYGIAPSVGIGAIVAAAVVFGFLQRKSRRGPKDEGPQA